MSAVWPGMPPVPRPPAPMRAPTQAPLERRRGTVGQVESMSGRPHRVQGYATQTGAGEASLEVRFPVWFIEKPIFSFGGELAEGQSPVAGAYPTISVVVLSWIRQEYPGNIAYYVGALLGPVTTGSDGQTIIVHWQFEGRALRNPTNDLSAPGVETI